MHKREHELGKLLENVCAENNIDARKLHGTAFQCGLPDYLLLGKRILLVELKIIRGNVAITDLLRGSQAGFFMRCQAVNCKDAIILASDNAFKNATIRRAGSELQMSLPDAFNIIIADCLRE
jgi:hypothetical protein